MDNRKIKLGIEEIKKISMTHEEKDMILGRVLNSDVAVSKVKSPWFSYFSFVKSSKLVYYIVVPLIALLTSGGIVFASSDSLPDSFLYPIKVKVLEPINEALKFTPESKAKYESTLASTRLAEAEKLANKGKLDLSKEEQINTLLASHTEALNKALNDMNKSNKATAAEDIAVNFRAEMNAHAKVLDALVKKDNQKLENKFSNNIDNNQTDNTNISENARSSADQIKQNQKNKNENNDEERYKNKKQNVESLINKVDQNVAEMKDDNESENESSSTLDVKNINESINNAKKYLDEANNKEQEGDKEDAYNSLLDSETSIKEADIFINSGTNINNRRGGNHKEERD